MTSEDCPTAPGPAIKSWTPPGQGPYAQPLIRAYGEGAFDELIAHPANEDGLRHALEARRLAPEIDRQALIEGFRVTYERAGLPVPKSVATLARPGTYVITTGQQLVIGGGPLYVAYKIQTTLALARRATALLGVPVLPVFWLAGEDDDLDEIITLRLGGRAWRWSPPAETAAGRLPLTGLAELLNEAGAPPLPWLRAYLARPTLAAAHTYLIDHWFGPEGLLILDPDQPCLKKALAPVLHREVTTPFVKEALERATPALTRLGLTPQLTSRAIGIFLLDEEGHRLRLDPDEAGPTAGYTAHYRRVSLPPQQWSIDDLQTLALMHPERFSPNAALRPVYEEAILPGIAYVGGPSELAYWWQLKGVFAEAGVPMPVVWPREQVVYIPGEVTDAGLPFTIEELLTTPLPTLEAMLLERAGATIPDLSSHQRALEEVHDRLLALAVIDRPEYAALAAESSRQRGRFSRLASRVERAHRVAHARTLAPLRRAADLLGPDGHLQERTESLLDYTLRYPQFLMAVRAGITGTYGTWRMIQGAASGYGPQS